MTKPKDVKPIDAEFEETPMPMPMSSHDFCRWLEGFFVGSRATELSAEQTKEIRDKLATVVPMGLMPIYPAPYPAYPGYSPVQPPWTRQPAG